MFYSQLGKTLNQLSKTIKQLDYYATFQLQDKKNNIALLSPEDIALLSRENQTKRSELENTYFTLNYYAMLLSKIEASIQTLQWYYSSTTLCKKFKLESVSEISAENLEGIIQNICQASDIFDEHKTRLQQLQQLKKPLRALFFCLVAAAIGGSVGLSLSLFLGTGAPLSITIMFCIFMSMIFSGIVSMLFYGLYDIHSATKESINLLNEMKIHCDNYTKSTSIHFSITEGFYRHSSKLGPISTRYYVHRHASYPQASDTSIAPESCFLTETQPGPNDFVSSAIFLSKTTSNTAQIKSKFFKEQDAEDKTLVQRALRC